MSLLAPSTTITGPEDSRIVLSIFEEDGTVSATELWGPTAEPLRAETMLYAALSMKLDERLPPKGSGVVFGEIHIDDELVIEHDGETISATRAGELLCAFIVESIKNLVTLVTHESEAQDQE